MIERAKQVMKKADLSDRAKLILLDIENPQVPDNIADVVISNCVINLCPCKPCVYKQIFDILKLAGRLAISDIVINRLEHIFGKRNFFIFYVIKR
jgi:SAM-dependent methyltransferase